MKAKLFFCIVALAVIALPLAGYADEKAGDGRHVRLRSQKMFAELGLTPEQETRLKEINIAAAANRKLMIKQLEVLREKIKVELLKEKPSNKELNKLAAQIGKHHEQMNKAAIKTLLDISQTLTPEQFAKLSAFGFMGDDPMVFKQKHGKGGAMMKPGDGPKHRYSHNSGGKKFKEGGGKPHRERCTPEQCRHVCNYKKEKGGFSGAPVPIAPPIGTLPEGASIGADSTVDKAE